MLEKYKANNKGRAEKILEVDIPFNQKHMYKLLDLKSKLILTRLTINKYYIFSLIAIFSHEVFVRFNSFSVMSLLLSMIFNFKLSNAVVFTIENDKIHIELFEKGLNKN